MIPGATEQGGNQIRAASITLHQEDHRLSSTLALFKKRLLNLTGFDLIEPLPMMINCDPVGSDIADVRASVGSVRGTANQFVY